MSIIIANGCNVINIGHDTTIILSVENPNNRLEIPNVPTYSLYQDLDSRNIIPRVSGNGIYSSQWQQCPQCTYKTRFLGNLRSHIKAMHSHDRRRKGKFEKHPYYQCGHCKFGSKSKQSLTNHMMAKHCEQTHRECPKCHTLLKNKMCLSSHLQYCGKEPAHKCNYCSFKTRYRTHLSRHLKNVHTEGGSIECPNQCGSILKNKESLRGHLNACGSELFSVQCRYCPFRPKRKSLLQLHISRVHDDMNNLTNQCPKCTKKFKKKAYLKRHIPICDSKPVFQCATCSHAYYKKSLLEKHLLQKHLDPSDDEDKYVEYLHCKRCYTGFKYQTDLSEHMVRCGYEVGFQCYHCPFRTRIKDHLKNHILCAHIESNEFYQINMRNYINDEAATGKPSQTDKVMRL